MVCVNQSHLMPIFLKLLPEVSILLKYISYSALDGDIMVSKQYFGILENNRISIYHTLILS